MPVISDVRHPLMYYDTNTLSLLLWDGSLQAGGLVIGHVVVDSGTMAVHLQDALGNENSTAHPLIVTGTNFQLTPNTDVPFITQIQGATDGTSVGNVLDALKTTAPTLIISIDSDASHNPQYLGLAAKNTTTAQALWQIRKFTIDGNSNVSAVRYANGSEAFNAVWDNRASLSYS